MWKRYKLERYRQKKFIAHLLNLKINFERYFPENTQQQDWIKDSFNADLSTFRH